MRKLRSRIKVALLFVLGVSVVAMMYTVVDGKASTDKENISGEKRIHAVLDYVEGEGKIYAMPIKADDSNEYDITEFKTAQKIREGDIVTLLTKDTKVSEVVIANNDDVENLNNTYLNEIADIRSKAYETTGYKEYSEYVLVYEKADEGYVKATILDKDYKPYDERLNVVLEDKYTMNSIVLVTFDNYGEIVEEKLINKN